MAELSPSLVAGLRAERHFVNRGAIEAARTGIAQFIQVGCGFPGTLMLHEAVTRDRHRARTVYADTDPAAVALIDMLTMGDSAVAAVVGDLQHPDELFASERVRAMLDLNRPLCLVTGSALTHVTDTDDPGLTLARWRDRLPAGSWLILAHPTPDGLGPEGAAAREAAETFEAVTGRPMALRTSERVAQLLDGWELRTPGIQPVNRWRPTLLQGPPVPMLGAIATLPAGRPDPGRPAPHAGVALRELIRIEVALGG